MDAEIDQLEHEVEKIYQQLDLSDDPELEKLVDENLKCRYRVQQLKMSIAKERAKPLDRMISVQAALSAHLQAAIRAAYPEAAAAVKVQLTSSAKEEFGDYQCSNAMSLAKAVKLQPRQVAAAIVDKLEAGDLIEKTEIAGPGFINISLRRQPVIEELNRLLVHGVRPPPVDRKRRVIVDYSSPNIAKQMHVGHLRSTIIGDSVARLCRFLGHEVLALNHVGDWGTQFGMLIAHLKDRFPDYATKCPPIGDLQAFYKESKVRFDSDEQFKQRAYAAVVSLQRRDPDSTAAWKLICDASRKDFQRVYGRLGVENLVERGESFYQDLMTEVVDELKSGGHLVPDEGRLIMWPPGCDIPLTVVKSDGGFTYDTSDLAAIRQRLFAESADWLIYVVDIGQGVHFKGIFSAAEKAGWLNPAVARVDHVGFGVVLGEDRKKFKTRSGDTVRLTDLLNEGIERAGAKLAEKGRDKELTPQELKAAQEAVAYGCIKYADLSHNRNNDYVFSFDKMLDDRGNTAVYLLYAYTRISSIARTANLSPDQLLKLAKSPGITELQHPKEWKLAKQLLRFADVVDKLTQDLLLHSLCDFLYETACVFTEFYDACYCIEKNRDSGEVIRVNHWRILLCDATAKIMKAGLDILGIRTVDRM
ncbi:hypothetical protein BOX15_Mlig013072g1 [Macrostomum lignano]|uniref:arginine--tRNA ligase n=2 Tax=Macrostomum lignano TaxID=282301 RepID=A0A267FKA6_9PLAT|nr:hypothetical protein BOX15_Mlig013072g1 [Macrostomum lignano]